MSNNKSELIRRADKFSVGGIIKIDAGTTQIMAKLINEMRDALAGDGWQERVASLKDDLKFNLGLANIECGCGFDCCCREFSKGMETVLIKVESHLGAIKLEPSPPQLKQEE